MKTVLASCLLLLLTCATSIAARQTPAEKAAAIELLTQMVSALNSRKEAPIRAFFEAHATDDIPIDMRVERMREFAEQGAPFKVEPDSAVTSDTIKATLVDRAGTRLSITLATTGGLAPRLKSMRAMPARTPGGPDRSLDDWKDLHDLTVKIATKRQAPAMSITVIRDGKQETAVTGVRKVDGKEAVGADEPWSIGSIGKPLCSTIIGMLIEQGRLRWEETLAEALTDVPMQEGYRAATIEQLMQHRGGIPQDGGFKMDRIREIVGDAKTPVAIRARYVRDILNRAPIGKPGQRNAYSNAGYTLLGHIAERTTGKPYEQLVREMIFAPLGLKHSYTGADALPDHRPSGHMKGPAGIKPLNMSGPMEYMFAPAGGGMWMSTADLAQFGAEHLKGLHGKDGLLKAATVSRLHRGLLEGEGTFRYASGWGIESNPGIETFHGHNGSNGTFRAQLAIFPKANLVVAAIVNLGGEEEPSPGLEAVLAIARRFAH